MFNRRTPRPCGWVLMAALVLSALGCGRSNTGLPPLVPVKGLVTLDGKPLAAATITLMPAGDTPGHGAYATTGDDGRYVLKSSRTEEPGVPTGEYKVMISKLTGATTSGEAPAAAADGEGETLSPKYSDYQKTTLTATVPESGGEINFELKSKP